MKTEVINTLMDVLSEKSLNDIVSGEWKPYSVFKTIIDGIIYSSKSLNEQMYYYVIGSETPFFQRSKNFIHFRFMYKGVIPIVAIFHRDKYDWSYLSAVK